MFAAGKTIVTVLCDSGQRHLSRFHNREYLARLGLTPTSTGTDLRFVTSDGGKARLAAGGTPRRWTATCTRQFVYDSEVLSIDDFVVLCIPLAE